MPLSLSPVFSCAHQMQPHWLTRSRRILDSGLWTGAEEAVRPNLQWDWTQLSPLTIHHTIRVLLNSLRTNKMRRLKSRSHCLRIMLPSKWKSRV